MIESCKQCGLAYLPELAAPTSLAEWLNSEGRVSSVTETGLTTLRIVASLEEGSRPLCEVLEAAGEFDEVVVAVGPEGDFTAGEYAALATAGFQPVRLGANVLRAETAGRLYFECGRSVCLKRLPGSEGRGDLVVSGVDLEHLNCLPWVPSFSSTQTRGW
jgi:RsmE family RNA methyltransferase